MQSNYKWSDDDNSYLNISTDEIISERPIEYKKFLNVIFKDSLEAKESNELNIDLNLSRQISNLLKVNNASLDSLNPNDCTIFEDGKNIIGFTIDGFLIDYEKDLLVDNQAFYIDEYNELHNIQENKNEQEVESLDISGLNDL